MVTIPPPLSDGTPVGSTLGTGLYFFFAFMIGVGISGVSPGLGIFFSRRFTGNNRIKMLGLVQGFFGIGAGFLPLIFAGVFYKATGKSADSFKSVQTFLFVATALAFFCIILSY